VRRRGSRGQGSVEFAVFLVALVLLLILLVQLAWIGVQKWQFNHFAAYAARSWSVNKKSDSPEKVLLEDQVFATLRWKLLSRSYVRFMWTLGTDTDSDGNTGVSYRGVAPIFRLFKPFFGDTLLGLNVPAFVSNLDPDLKTPNFGWVQFQAFVPMAHEPEEDPDRYDNDCSDPCDDNEQ
jgi:hypothetical protein